MHSEDYKALAKDHTADAGQTEAGATEALTRTVNLNNNQQPIGPNTIDITPSYLRRYFTPTYATAESVAVFHFNHGRAISNHVYERLNGMAPAEQQAQRDGGRTWIDSFNSFVDSVLLHEVVTPVSSFF